MNKLMFRARRPLINRKVFRYAKLFAGACLLILFLDLLPNVLTTATTFCTSESNRSRSQPVIWIPFILPAYNTISTLFYKRTGYRIYCSLSKSCKRSISPSVSISESGSKDRTKATLSKLAASLKTLSIDHTVYLDNETHAAAIEKSLSSTSTSGWLRTRYGKELWRIFYLADIWNRALEPLRALNQAGIRFDMVLYLTDVVHSVCFSMLRRDASHWSWQLNNPEFRLKMRFRSWTPGMESTLRRAH